MSNLFFVSYFFLPGSVDNEGTFYVILGVFICEKLVMSSTRKYSFNYYVQFSLNVFIINTSKRFRLIIKRQE